MSWPWANYLGDENAATGIRAKISSWKRVGPNTIPHVAKATGIYLNSMLAVHEAQRAGYDEAILLTDDGFVADGSGENVFVVKDGRIWTPPLSTSILPGITRDSVIQIAQDLGYVVEETNLVRSDLYLADEIFMTGTAAEVTPVRSVDDHEIGVGPVTLELQKAYLDTVRGTIASAGATGSTTSTVGTRRRLEPRREGGHPADPALVAVPRRAGRGARPRGAALGAALARPHDRPLRGALRRARRSAVRGRRLVGHRGLHLLCGLAGLGPGDEAITSPYSFVASANCAIYEGATPVFADIDERTLNLDPAAVEAAITPRTKASSPSTSSATPASSTRCGSCASGTG